MICNCTLAGTAACRNCPNRYIVSDDYDYSKWFHVELPVISDQQLKECTKNLFDIQTFNTVTVDLNCSNCKYYIRDIVDGIEFVNHNYCNKGVNVASPAFYCKWYERHD